MSMDYSSTPILSPPASPSRSTQGSHHYGPSRTSSSALLHPIKPLICFHELERQAGGALTRRPDPGGSADCTFCAARLWGFSVPRLELLASQFLSKGLRGAGGG